jgi:outer membrane lipoprotein-sorting protein
VRRRPAGRRRCVPLRGTATLVPALTLAIVCMASMVQGTANSSIFMGVLEAMQQAYAQIDHYTATFLTQERIDGELRPEQRVALKFKKPFKVYLRWVKGRNEGRQALYPAGADGHELWVRVPMLVGGVTVSLDPLSPRARKGSRHPITEVGIGRLLDLINENAKRGIERGEVTIEDAGRHSSFERPTHRYILHFPDSPTKGYYCMTAVLEVDHDHRLPTYAEIFDWDGQLIERYGYLDLRLNLGLTDEDFNPKNPEYGF